MEIQIRDGDELIDGPKIIEHKPDPWDYDFPVDRNSEKDKKTIIKTPSDKRFDLQASEHQSKFVRICYPSTLRKIKEVIKHNPHFEISQIKSALFMCMMENIPGGDLRKLYTFNLGETFENNEYTPFKGYDIGPYLKAIDPKLIAPHVKQILKHTAYYLMRAGYCTNTALHTFIESLNNHLGTFVLVGKELYYFKTDKQNKTGIHTRTGTFGMFDDYHHSLLLKVHHLIQENKGDDDFFNHMRDELSVSTKNGFPLITFYDKDIKFISSTVHPTREREENVQYTAKNELKILGRYATDIFSYEQS